MALQLFKIATVNLTSAQSSIDFTSIPSGYTDLKITGSLMNSTGANVYVRFNSTTTGYTERFLYGTGSAAQSGTNTLTGFAPQFSGDSSQYTANTFGNGELYIPNYNSSNYKSVSLENVVENNGTTGWQMLFAGLWSNTAAITSITLTPYGGGNFAAGSIATLYGVL